MASTPASTSSPRVASIDLARGIVMVLMAIDHVRVFSGVPAGGPEPAVFFTRWITHFCAPAFVFLAGTSAFLYGRRHEDLPRFLWTRGLWLVFLELTVLRVAWTFNFRFLEYEMAGVIWAIGWCMVLMAGLVRLPVRVVGAIGLAIVFGHNLMDAHLDTMIPALKTASFAGLWKILYFGFFGGPIRFGPDGPSLIVLYSIVPWIGVMAAGYAFGSIVMLPANRRDRICVALGLGAIGLFLALRGLDAYGDPRTWHELAAGANGRPGLAFLNTTKYPASLSFLLMTLGPTLALLPALERIRGAAARVLTIFGRVPFFFYVLHIPLIHALALVVSRLRTGEVDPWLFANHPMAAGPPPDGYRWSLPLLYLVWAIVVALLYLACRWYVGVKARRSLSEQGAD